MTDSTRGTGVPHGPPWSVDVLADLHAGALDAKQSAALWARVNNDPEAQAILAALDAVRRDLDALGDAPVEPMPAHFAERLDDAIAAEAAKNRPGVAPVVDMAEARRKRTRRMGWAAGIVAVAAAAIAVTFVALPGEQSTGGSPVAGNIPADTTATPGDQPPLALKSGPGLGAQAFAGIPGKGDFGPMGDEQGLKDCLSAHGIDNPQVMGAREVTLDGAEGVAALLARGENGRRFRLVVVEPTCTKDDPGQLISDTSLG